MGVGINSNYSQTWARVKSTRADLNPHWTESSHCPRQCPRPGQRRRPRSSPCSSSRRALSPAPSPMSPAILTAACVDHPCPTASILVASLDRFSLRLIGCRSTSLVAGVTHGDEEQSREVRSHTTIFLFARGRDSLPSLAPVIGASRKSRGRQWWIHERSLTSPAQIRPKLPSSSSTSKFLLRRAFRSPFSTADRPLCSLQQPQRTEEEE